MKGKLSGGSLNELFIKHGEKFVFGLIVVIAGWLCYASMKVEGVKKGQTPEKLITEVSSTRQLIENSDYVEKVKKEATAPLYVQGVAAGQAATLPKDYAVTSPWDPPKEITREPRKDPTLYPPIQLQVTQITGAIAEKISSDRRDITEDDKPAPMPKKEVKKKPKKKKKKKAMGEMGGMAAAAGMSDEGGDDEGGAGMMGMAGMMAAMGGGGGAAEAGAAGEIRRFPGKPPQGSYRPGQGGLNVAAEGGAMGMATGGGGFAAPKVGDDGGGEGGAASAASMMGGGGAAAKPTVHAVGKHIIAVMALVPYEKQLEEFLNVLGTSVEYEGSRDRPYYFAVIGQRADVTQDPNRQVKDDEWVTVMNTTIGEAQRENWEGALKEVVDPSFIDPKLTFPAPPLMMREPDSMVWHKALPRKGMVLAEEDAAAEDEGPKLKDELGIFGSQKVAKKQQSGGDMMSQMMPAGNEDGGDDDGSGGGDGSTQETTEYKLVRFFDMSGKAGRVYRYRVRLVMEDPNNPNTSPDIQKTTGLPVRTPPAPRSLDQSVTDRLSKQPRNIVFRLTDWSEVSQPISIELPGQILAGNVEQAKPMRGRDFSVGEPFGTVKAVVWDHARAVDMPVDRQVYRGSVLNFTADTEYAHPATLVIKLAENYSVRTNFMVADIRGGELLPYGTKDKPIRAPGEFAIFDANGNLIVRTELDDRQMFRKYNLLPEVVEDPMAGGDADEGDDPTSMMKQMMGAGGGGDDDG